MKEGIVLELEKNKAVIITNNGEFLSVPAKSDWQVGITVSVSDFEMKANQTKKKDTKKYSFYRKRSVLIAIVASLLFFIIPLSSITKAQSIVTLDINPSIEMVLKNGNVIDTHPLNKDGENVISHLNNEQKTGALYKVTSEILNEAEQLGYLKQQDNNVIMVGVLNNDHSVQSNELKTYIKDQLTEKKLNADVLVLQATKTEKKQADQKGVSLGKYLLQSKEKKDGIIISDEELQKTSIKDIVQQVNEEKKKKQNERNSKEDKNTNKNKQNNAEKNNSEKKSNNENNSSIKQHEHLQNIKDRMKEKIKRGLNFRNKTTSKEKNKQNQTDNENSKNKSEQKKKTESNDEQDNDNSIKTGTNNQGQDKSNNNDKTQEKNHTVQNQENDKSDTNNEVKQQTEVHNQENNQVNIKSEDKKDSEDSEEKDETDLNKMVQNNIFFNNNN